MTLEVEAKFLGIDKERVLKRLNEAFGDVKGKKKVIHDIYYTHEGLLTEEDYKKGSSMRLRLELDENNRVKKVKLTLKTPVSFEGGTLRREEHEVVVHPDNAEQLIGVLTRLGFDEERVRRALGKVDLSDPKQVVELLEKELGLERLYTVTKERRKYKLPEGELVIDTIRAATMRKGKKYRWGLGERTHAEIEAKSEEGLEKLVSLLGLNDAVRAALTQYSLVKEFLNIED